MVSSGSLSDGLRTALSNGAEIGLARAFLHGEQSEESGHYIATRLSHLSSLDLTYLQQLAHDIIRAAQYVGGLFDTEDIDADQIPTNPAADDTEWSGKRLFWFGEWSIPGEAEVYKFSGTLPDITDFGDIAAYAAQLAASYIEAYPTRFPGSDNLGDMTPEVRILGIEKGF